MNVIRLESRIMNSDDNKGEVANSNDGNTEDKVVRLNDFRKVSNPQVSIHQQMHTMLAANGINFGCDQVKSDYQILAYVVQGMLDRSMGEKSDRSVFMDMLRMTLGYTEPVNEDDTTAMFGDLLSKLD
jgi:hypothetical protein